VTIMQYVAWMERQFNACQTPRSMYLSIFNSFRVIRCLSQCVSPKIAIFNTLLFPLGTPLGNHAKCCMDEKRIRCLQIVSSMYPSIYRSPGCSTYDIDHMILSVRCLQMLCSTDTVTFILGDYNLPDIDWSYYHAPDNIIYNTFLTL